MRTFIRRSLVFLALAVALLAAIELTVRSWDNSYKLKQAWMAANGNEVETLFLGNSHAYFGFCPSAVAGKAFNLANVSQTLDYDEELLRHYLPLCKSLKTVVINYDHSNAFDPSIDRAEPSRAAFYRIYMGLPRHSGFSEYGFELLHAASLQGKLTKHLHGNDLETDSLGWGTAYKAALRDSNAVSQQEAEIRIKGHTFSDFSDAYVNKQHLFSIAEMCRSNHIRLIIVQTPVSTPYYQVASFRQQEFIDNVLEECKTTYDATIVDLRQDDRFADSDFFDTDHLADEGARKLSLIINEIIR